MKDSLKIIIYGIIAVTVVLAPIVLVLLYGSETHPVLSLIISLTWLLLLCELSGRRRTQQWQHPGSAGHRKSNETQNAQRQGQTGSSRENRARVPARPFKKPTWREVLGFKEGEKPTLHEVESGWRRLAKSAHPDVGGTDAQMAELNTAMREARKELRDKETG